MNFLSYLISGISLGSVYALIALGYTMVYGIAKMLNFAHGDVIMIGGFVIFTAVSSMHTSAGVAIVCAIIVCTVLGVTIEKIAYKPLRNAPPLAVLITAIGVSYFLQNMALLIFGSASRNFPDILNLPDWHVAEGLTVTGEAILTIAATIVIMIALTAFINHTRIGSAMQAVSEDRGAAQLMGVNVNSTISVTFAIGSALAAVASPFALLVLSADRTVHRRDAGHQGIRSGSIRRHRLHSGRDDRRHPARRDRKPEQGIYFLDPVRRNRIRRADHRTARQADRYSRQDHARESVGGRHEKQITIQNLKQDDPAESDHLCDRRGLFRLLHDL